MGSMDDFAPRGAPLEYWFWKFHAGDLAFLVDFILRRRTDEAEVRVSIWVRGEGRVERLVSRSWSADTNTVSIGGQRLTSSGSTGATADISWELRWQPGEPLVDPRPWFLGPMHPFDMELLLRPAALFSGVVTVAGERFDVIDVPGLLTHYWGRRLAKSWCWISATEFEDSPVRRVEFLIARSGLWGRDRLVLPFAYLWTTDGQRSELTLSPVYGLIRQRRVSNGVAIKTWRINGRRHRLTCTAGADAFNDLGEGIRQTLLADLVFDGHRALAGRTGLEFRDTRG
jgi:hypothetical protein